MRICNQPRRHPHRNSIQIHGLELMSLSVLYGFRELRVVLGNSYPAYMRLRSALYVGPCLHSIAQCPLATGATNKQRRVVLGAAERLTWCSAIRTAAVQQARAKKFHSANSRAPLGSSPGPDTTPGNCRCKGGVNNTSTLHQKHCLSLIR